MIGEPDQIYVRIGERHYDFYGRSVDVAETRPWQEGEPFKRYDADGFELYEESVVGPDAHARLTIKDKGRTLRLLVPHLNNTSPSVTLTEQFILFSTHEGTVECIDRSTGASRWLYVSNWNSGLVSYTGGTLIDWNELVREYDEQATDIDKRTPSLLVPESAYWAHETAIASGATVIEDPDPIDPYADFRELRTAMRIMPFLIAGLMAIGWFFLRKKEKADRWIALGSALLFCSTVLLLGFFFALSILGTFMWLAEACVLIIATAFFSIQSIRLGQSKFIPVLSGLMVVGCLWWVWPIGRWVPWLFEAWLS